MTFMNMREHAELIENATRKAGVDKSLTLGAWHDRTVAIREAVLQLKAERDTKLKQANEDYKGERLASVVGTIEDEYGTALEYARTKVEDDLQTVLDGKRRAWRRANQPPTADMLNLLNALQLRGNDLTAGEVVSTVEALNGNAPALRALRSICSRAGLMLPKFIGVDPDKFNRDMQDAEEYAKNGVSSLDVDHASMGYWERLFWDAPGRGLDELYFKELDSSTLTAAEIAREDDTTKPTKEKADNISGQTTGTSAGSGERWSKVTIDGDGFSPSSVAEQFHVSTEQLRAANPGVDLRSLKQGDTVLIPSTRMKMWPGVKYAVQENQVEIVDAPPLENYPAGFGEVKDLALSAEN